MRTKDSISKRKQKLRQESLYWDARAAETMAQLSITPEEQETKNRKAIFCRQEAAKRRADIDKLQTRTRWQIYNGWK